MACVHPKPATIRRWFSKSRQFSRSKFARQYHYRITRYTFSIALLTSELSTQNVDTSAALVGSQQVLENCVPAADRQRLDGEEVLGRRISGTTFGRSLAESHLVKVVKKGWSTEERLGLFGKFSRMSLLLRCGRCELSMEDGG